MYSFFSYSKVASNFFNKFFLSLVSDKAKTHLTNRSYYVITCPSKFPNKSYKRWWSITYFSYFLFENVISYRNISYPVYIFDYIPSSMCMNNNNQILLINQIFTQARLVYKIFLHVYRLWKQYCAFLYR